MSADEIIEAITDRQRGRTARWQLLTAGVDRSTITRRLERGRLIFEHPCVYALPGTSGIAHAADAAALLSAGPSSLLADHSAMVLYGIRPGVARPVHVVVPSHLRGVGRTPELIVHRSKLLTPADARVHDGLPVTSPARAFLDVSARLPDSDVERLLGDAIYALRLLTLDEVNELLPRSAGHPGAPRLTRVVAQPPVQTDSLPETSLLELIRQARLPEPVTRFEHPLGYRFDFYWPDHKVIVEVDAYGTHGSPAKFESDRRRDQALTLAGYRVIRFTRRQIEMEPLAVIAALAGILHA